MKRLPQTAAREPYRVLWQQAVTFLPPVQLLRWLVSEIVFREQMKAAGF